MTRIFPFFHHEFGQASLHRSVSDRIRRELRLFPKVIAPIRSGPVTQGRMTVGDAVATAIVFAIGAAAVGFAAVDLFSTAVSTVQQYNMIDFMRMVAGQ